MKNKIYNLLRDFVAVESISCTRTEREASVFIRDYFAKFPYFQAHPEHFGICDIPDDPYDRTIPYAFLKGNSANTVVIMGHFDVVGIEDYGEAKPLAFDLDNLEAKLKTMDLPPEARADMDSGEWLWARGVEDMKAGLVVDMVLMEDYAKMAEEGALPGCIFFMGVPDEESYSAGMRAGVKLLADFKKKYGLKLNIMLDPEPCAVTEDGTQIISVGSVGKTMPVVMVQGVQAHVGHKFAGFSPLSVIGRIQQKTEESLAFTDTYQGEATVPPTWANLRDLKKKYDVTIPHRAAGYMTVLSFQSTPDQIMERLKAIAKESFEEAIASWADMLGEYNKKTAMHMREEYAYETPVFAFGELCGKLKAEKGAAFDAFFAAEKEKIEAMILAGEVNYQDGTVAFMEDLLNFADIKQPLVLLAFAPPYYLAFNSNLIPGKENSGEELYAFASSVLNGLGRKTAIEYYMQGISDLSYAGMDHPFDTDAYSANTPVWGRMYSIDFEALAEINTPCTFTGPIGKDPHQWTERLLKKSLYEECPAFNRALIDRFMQGE